MTSPEQPTDLLEMVTSDAYLTVRRRVMRQLVEALIFERLLVASETGAEDGLDFTISGTDAGGAPVAYVCRGRRRSSFGRIRLEQASIMRIGREGPREAESPSQLLLETAGAHGAGPAPLAQFIAEIEQTLIKDAQAQHFAHAEGHPLRTRTYDDIESALADGHPYHPSYKSRVGFDLVDNRRFGPEFGPTLRPLWLATHRSRTRMQASEGLDVPRFLRDELGDEALSRWTGILESRGRSAAEYALLPVHPWQWERQLAPLLFQDVREGWLVPLGPAPDAYRPQQSIRTLANHTSPRKASLKQALSIVNTSTARILAPHTVQNAPLISDWLSRTVASDPFLRDELRPILLREVLGVAYESPRSELSREATYGAVSCIWRESLHRHLEPKEEALPWAALTSRDRDGRPLIDDWVRAMGPEAFVRRILEVSVLPVMHLLIAHGIGLESHAQNMVLIHRGGRPVRVALKDFHDGVRFSSCHLARPENAPTLFPTPAHHLRVNRNSFVTTESPAAVRDFVLDAFFHINLGEVALFMEEQYAIKERWFWQTTRDLLSTYRRRFSDLEPRFAVFDLETATIEVERLTHRRLFSETGVQEHAVPNPLSPAQTGARLRLAKANA